MNRLAILGGSGLGAAIVKEASDHDVRVYDLPDFNIHVKNSMMVLGRVIQRTRPAVFVFNASGPVTENHSNGRINALQILWPFIKTLDLTMVVISSAAGWNQIIDEDPAIRLFRKINSDLSNATINLCRKTTTNPQLARTILFEPAVTEFSVAEKFNTTYLTNKDMWSLIKLGIDAKMPFIRLGCQGDNV